MEKLWAPWRLEYITAESSGQCVFCLDDDLNLDAERLVLLRGERVFVVMNRYPYSNGHLLIVTYRHLHDLADLESDEILEIHRLLTLCQQVLRDSCAAQGFNIGWNIGQVAGAGIADHLHLHIVPRWAGDTNYMPVLADLRVIPQYLNETYTTLEPIFRGLAEVGR